MLYRPDISHVSGGTLMPFDLILYTTLTLPHTAKKKLSNKKKPIFLALLVAEMRTSKINGHFSTSNVIENTGTFLLKYLPSLPVNPVKTELHR